MTLSNQTDRMEELAATAPKLGDFKNRLDSETTPEPGGSKKSGRDGFQGRDAEEGGYGRSSHTNQGFRTQKSCKRPNSKASRREDKCQGSVGLSEKVREASKSSVARYEFKGSSLRGNAERKYVGRGGLLRQEKRGREGFLRVKRKKTLNDVNRRADFGPPGKSAIDHGRHRGKRKRNGEGHRLVLLRERGAAREEDSGKKANPKNQERGLSYL